MANINHDGSFRVTGMDLKILELCKIRGVCKCILCEKNLAKGCIVLSKVNVVGWDKRVCVDCAFTFLNNFLNSLKEMKNRARRLIDDITLNKETYDKNNLIASI